MTRRSFGLLEKHRPQRYIAPEAYCGIYTTASDIFALGVMLYKVSTGSLPFCEEIFDDEAGQNYVGHVKMNQIRSKLRLAKVESSRIDVLFSTDIVATEVSKIVAAPGA